MFYFRFVSWDFGFFDGVEVLVFGKVLGFRFGEVMGG